MESNSKMVSVNERSGPQSMLFQLKLFFGLRSVAVLIVRSPVVNTVEGGVV